jgi:hypothetical protein
MRIAEMGLNITSSYRRILESRMMRKYHVRFGGGPGEKELKSYLARGLPNL